MPILCAGATSYRPAAAPPVVVPDVHVSSGLGTDAVVDGAPAVVVLAGAEHAGPGGHRRRGGSVALVRAGPGAEARRPIGGRSAKIWNGQDDAAGTYALDRPAPTLTCERRLPSDPAAFARPSPRSDGPSRAQPSAPTTKIFSPTDTRSGRPSTPTGFPSPSPIPARPKRSRRSPRSVTSTASR